MLQAYDMMRKAREHILEHIPREVVSFPARLEKRTMRFACAASLLNYFHSKLDYVPVSEDALEYATQLYVEEASVRSREEFKLEEVFRKTVLEPSPLQFVFAFGFGFHMDEVEF